jgi:hypothetical protein
MKRPSTALVGTGVLALVAGLVVVGRSPDVPGALVIRTTVATSVVDASDAAESTPLATSSTTSTTSTTLVTRAAVVVAVANATDERGVAAAMVDRLRAYDYLSVTALDAVAVTESTVVYFAPGFGTVAQRLALDAGLSVDAVAPIGEAPALEDDVLTQLLIVIGTESL